MDRMEKIFLIAGAAAVIAVVAWIVVSAVGISTEHHSMEGDADMDGYDGLYVFDSVGMTEATASSIPSGSYIFVGEGWAKGNENDLKSLIGTWLDGGSTIVTEKSSTFDVVKDSMSVDFEPSASLHAIYRTRATTFCLSLTCEDDWKGHVLDPEWRSTARSYSVMKEKPCCISTSVYQSGTLPDIVSTNIFWFTSGSQFPKMVVIDGEVEFITSSIGFFCVNFLDFDSDGKYMNEMEFRTSTDGDSYRDMPVDLSLDGNEYRYVMHLESKYVAWSVPLTVYGPSSFKTDRGGEYGAESWTNATYGFTVPPESLGLDGSLQTSAGGSFLHVGDTYAGFNGGCSVYMKYQDGLNKHAFDIRTEFSLHIE